MTIALRRGAVVVGVALVAALACSESPTEPGNCPTYCPGTTLGITDTILRAAVVRDSSYRGYIRPVEASVLLASEQASVVSRPIWRTLPTAPRVRLATSGNDTTTAPVLGDSSRIDLILSRINPVAKNLTLQIYRMPLTIDSQTTFADLAGDFAAPPIRSVNVDSLLRRSGQKDSVTGDSLVAIDTAAGEVTISLKFDTLQIPYVPDDTGKVALGLRVAADSLPAVALGATEGGAGPEIRWYVSIDSAGVRVPRGVQRRLSSFDTFVFDPPEAPLDSNLTLGGMPTVRTVLRLALPGDIRDSTQILRATLYLVPAAPVPGTSADSFLVGVQRLAADLGAKSPVAIDTSVFHSAAIRPGQTDTIRIELTSMLRYWQVDTAAKPAMLLRLLAINGVTSAGTFNATEGATFDQLRLYGSNAAGFRPSLHLTYAPRFRFEQP